MTSQLLEELCGANDQPRDEPLVVNEAARIFLASRTSESFASYNMSKLKPQRPRHGFSHRWSNTSSPYSSSVSSASISKP